jgi:hypothetical protein
MKYFVTFLSLLMLVLCGCSKPTHPPAELSQRIAEADHVVVTNHYRAFGSAMSGAEISSLAKAVASAKKKTVGADFDWMSPRVWDIEFYTGTNHLAVVPVCYGIFQLEGVEYADSTGVIEAFWKKLDEDRAR